MVHTRQVERVEIDENCNVQLLRKSGRDLRGLDISAGEQQLFAQALISAVAKVSGRTFPMLIDTPLARLDVAHRLGVLRHFTDNSNQIILLSTDAEVVGEYLDAIAPRVCKTYRIEHEEDGDVGKSRPVEGYFDGGRSTV